MFTYIINLPVRPAGTEGLPYMAEHRITLPHASATFREVMDAWRQSPVGQAFQSMPPHRVHGTDYPRGHCFTINGIDTFACGDRTFDGYPAAEILDCYEINAEYTHG